MYVYIYGVFFCKAHLQADLPSWHQAGQVLLRVSCTKLIDVCWAHGFMLISSTFKFCLVYLDRIIMSKLCDWTAKAKGSLPELVLSDLSQ